MPALLGVHHIALTVTDLDRSTEWYVRILGFEPGPAVPDRDGNGRKQALLGPGESFRLTLVQHAGNDGSQASEHHTGLDHLAFTVTDREELERWLARLDEHGIEHSQIKEGLFGYLITFRDPDNIQLEVYTRSK